MSKPVKLLGTRGEDIPGLSMFWIKWGDSGWPPCSEGECCVPSYPDLRLMEAPKCYYHQFMSAPDGGARKGRVGR